MSEYDSLIEGYDSSLPTEDPGPLSDEEHQAMMEMMEPARNDSEQSEQPSTVSIEDELVVTELRALKPDQRPYVGQHYVIYGGKPMPVLRGQISLTEDEFVRDHLDVDGLKDHDGQRRARADRTLRLRYRGYVCGEMNSL